MSDVATCENRILELPLEVKTGEAPGTFSGYGAIFGNVDRDGDIVARGAFAESLKGRVPALLWQHNAKEPIGRFDLVREDEKGLYVEGRLAMTGRGLEAYALLKMGALDGLSIGFVTREATRDVATGVRTITQADLMEISLVTFPANELARVGTVKAAQGLPDSPRAFERFLRAEGFSRTRAKAITARGYDAPAAGQADIAALVGLLKQSGARLECKERQSLRLMPKYPKHLSFGPFLLARGRDFKVDVSMPENGGDGDLLFKLVYFDPEHAASGRVTRTEDFIIRGNSGVHWFRVGEWAWNHHLMNVELTVENRGSVPKDVTIIVDRR